MTESFLAPKIVIINTRAANVHSVDKALRKVGANPVITSDPEELASADAAVLPGVGASDAVMTALNSLRLTDPVKRFAASGRPLLCICIGLQVLFNSSEEGDLPGLGLVQGSVKLIPAGMKDKAKNHTKKHRRKLYKLPHWSTVPLHSYTCTFSKNYFSNDTCFPYLRSMLDPKTF